MVDIVENLMLPGSSIVNIFDAEDKGHRDDLEDLSARHRPLVREKADMF